MHPVSLQTLLQQHFPRFIENHKLPLYQYKTARHLMECRTEKLGGHTQYCENGHVNGVWYNSCKDRACPKCKGIHSERWLRKTESVLLRCPHHHIIFTLPHELNGLWSHNRSLMTDILFKAVQETLKQLSQDERYLNATPGFINALHTWGRNLSLHPHIHCLITHGGLTKSNKWKQPKKKCLFPRKVVMMIFRGKIRAFINDHLSRGELNIPLNETEQTVKNLCNKLGRKEWVVHFCKRYDHGEGVAKYIARYVRGGPLKNKQIQITENGQVSFSYTSHQTKKLEYLNIRASDFIIRWLHHVPIPRKQMVRSYGLYSPRSINALNSAKSEHHQNPVSKPEMLMWQEYLEGLDRLKPCPKCGAGLKHGEEVKFQRQIA